MNRSKNNKTTYILIPVVLISLLLTGTVQAQDQLAIPLSNPDEPGKLVLSAVRGDIKVSGYNGKDVIIRYSGDDEEEQKVTEDGLRRISSSSIGFEAEENGNTVKIRGVSPMSNTRFDISVPRNFSLDLSLVHGDAIRVENVIGTMEIRHTNGEVFLINVGGSAIVNTVNGDIEASFSQVDENEPMAFSNVNGDIDITLPANTKATVKLRSEWGEIFTDFDMKIDRTDKENKERTDSGVYKVSVNNWIYGNLNGGGPQFMVKTLRGDIFIRKR